MSRARTYAVAARLPIGVSAQGGTSKTRCQDLITLYFPPFMYMRR